MPGDLHHFSDHRVLRGGIAVVELQCIRPAGEIRITSVGEQQVAAFALGPCVVVRGTREIEFGSRDVILGMVFHPRMIQAGVVGDEIEHQPEATIAETLT